MFAIIEDGGRQYRVSPGTELAVDLREGLEAGQQMQFDRILLANGGGDSLIGQPLIEGASVTASVLDPYFKGPKLEIQKFRRRKNSKRHTGHRQKYLIVKIDELNIPGLDVVEQPEPEETVQEEINETVTTEVTEDAPVVDDQTPAEEQAEATESDEEK